MRSHLSRIILVKSQFKCKQEDCGECTGCKIEPTICIRMCVKCITGKRTKNMHKNTKPKCYLIIQAINRIRCLVSLIRDRHHLSLEIMS